jgi:preprotein translocase subunit SecY
MNSGLRRRAFTLSALLVSRIGNRIWLPGLDPQESDRSFCAGGAPRGCTGTRFGLTYLIAIVTAETLNRAAAAVSRR